MRSLYPWRAMPSQGRNSLPLQAMSPRRANSLPVEAMPARGGNSLPVKAMPAWVRNPFAVKALPPRGPSPLNQDQGPKDNNQRPKNKEQRTSAISSLLIWWAGQGGATTTVQYNIANSKTSTYRFVLFISPFGLREPIFRLLFWRKIFVVAEKAYFVHYVYRAYTYVNVSLSAA